MTPLFLRKSWFLYQLTETHISKTISYIDNPRQAVAYVLPEIIIIDGGGCNLRKLTP